jgi:hypothetical protein
MPYALSPMTAITNQRAVMPNSVDTRFSHPVVIEGTTTNSSIVLGTRIPTMLQRTRVTKKPGFFSFGVYP